MRQGLFWIAVGLAYPVGQLAGKWWKEHRERERRRERSDPDRYTVDELAHLLAAKQRQIRLDEELAAAVAAARNVVIFGVGAKPKSS